MRLDTLPLVFLLLGAAVAAPPGSKEGLAGYSDLQRARWRRSEDPRRLSGKKNAWEYRYTNTLGAIQCGYLALYDRAEPRAAELEDYLSARNPESYAWFGLTSAIHDKDSMDWSSGVAQKAGGSFKGVYTSKDGYREDKFVPINTCPAGPDADSDRSS